MKTKITKNSELNMNQNIQHFLVIHAVKLNSFDTPSKYYLHTTNSIKTSYIGLI